MGTIIDDLEKEILKENVKINISAVKIIRLKKKIKEIKSGFA